MSFEHLCTTLIELVGIPSTSGHEEQIRSYLVQLSGGSVRNAIPADVYIEGELHSFGLFETHQRYR